MVNIGTCVTALIASFNCDTNAKRVAMIHFLQRVIASIVTYLCCLFPFVSIVEGWTPGDVTRQIANFHQWRVPSFLSVLFLMPVAAIKLAKIIVPESNS